MNDIITDLSASSSEDQSTVNAAWEFAKKQALSKYRDTDEEYFPYVTSLTKQLISRDQEENPMEDTEKESMFSEPAPDTNYAPKQSFMKQEKIEDISDKKDRNPKYCQTEIIFDMIKGFESKDMCDEEIVHSLGMRLKVSPQEAEEILSLYRLSDGKDQIVDLGKDVDLKSFTIVIKEAKVEEEDGIGTVMSGAFSAAPFDAGRNRAKWKADWDSQKPKQKSKSKPNCKVKNKKKRFVDLSNVDQ